MIGDCWLYAGHGMKVHDLLPSESSLASKTTSASLAAGALIKEMGIDGLTGPELLSAIKGIDCSCSSQDLFAVAGGERRSLGKIKLAKVTSYQFPSQILPDTFFTTLESKTTRLKDLTPEPQGEPSRVWIILSSSGWRLLMDCFSERGALRNDLHEAFSMQDGSQVIGRGTYATVQRMKKQVDGTFVAVKNLIKDVDVDAIEREVCMLIECGNHPNIVGFRGIFWRYEEGILRLSLAFEFAPHGDLFRMVVCSGSLTEDKSRRLLRGIIAGLCYIHGREVVHRDIKTENVLLRNSNHAVIADFGLATFISDQDQMVRRCGTPGFIAPEVCVGKQYGFKIDSFAAGVILYFVLSQKMPFTSPDRDTMATMKLTVKCELHLRQPPFDIFTAQLRNFMRQLMAKDVSKRLSASEAHEHAWLARSSRTSSSSLPQHGVESGPPEMISPKRLPEGIGAPYYASTSSRHMPPLFPKKEEPLGLGSLTEGEEMDVSAAAANLSAAACQEEEK